MDKVLVIKERERLLFRNVVAEVTFDIMANRTIGLTAMIVVGGSWCQMNGLQMREHVMWALDDNPNLKAAEAIDATGQVMLNVRRIE